MSEKLITLLAIGGSDPCGGAGIQADIRAGVSLGLHIATAITSVTVQNSSGLKKTGQLNSSLLKEQLEAISEDVFPNAVKIGMIGSLENGKVISEFISSLPDEVPIVVDPVLSASAGGILSSSSLEELMLLYQNDIIPYCTAVTPNIEEGRLFLQFNERKTNKSPEALSSELLGIWNCNAVILKGGHGEDKIITDYIADNFDGVSVISKTSHPRLDCNNLHGTGCVFSSFLASYLALGFPLIEAFMKTSNKMYEVIRRSGNYSFGKTNYGPLNINEYRL